MPVILPFQPSLPFYRVSTVLDGQTYQLNVRWNSRDEAWYFDLLTDEGVMLAAGVKVVLGVFLARRVTSEDRLGGALIASDLSGAELDAGLDDMGTRVLVYYYSAEELAA